MKSSFNPVKYLVLSILIFIAWHLHPKISHICHEKICPVITSAKKEFYWPDTRKYVECPPIGAEFRLSWFINHEEGSEEGEELFKATHCQARAPPVKEGKPIPTLTLPLKGREINPLSIRERARVRVGCLGLNLKVNL